MSTFWTVSRNQAGGSFRCGCYSCSWTQDIVLPSSSLCCQGSSSYSSSRLCHETTPHSDPLILFGFRHLEELGARCRWWFSLDLDVTQLSQKLITLGGFVIDFVPLTELVKAERVLSEGRRLKLALIIVEIHGSSQVAWISVCDVRTVTDEP